MNLSTTVISAVLSGAVASFNLVMFSNLCNLQK